MDAAIGDNGVIAYRVSQNPALKTVEDPSFPEEGFGIVVKKGDKPLQDKLNAGLATIRADGSYGEIYKKWFAKECQGTLIAVGRHSMHCGRVCSRFAGPDGAVGGAPNANYQGGVMEPELWFGWFRPDILR